MHGKIGETRGQAPSFRRFLTRLELPRNPVSILTLFRHLTYVEDRLLAFETALGRLFPGGDLDATVRSLLHDQDGPKPGSSSKSSSRHSTPAKTEADRTEPAPEALPQKADGFDWTENKITVGDLTDGMASLSIKPEGTGYFGLWDSHFRISNG